MRRPHPQRGFTLIEAIVVIVVLGIVASMVAVFIRMPVLGYRDSANRAELADIADLTLRRMGREIRLALPNSINVINNGQGVQFLMTKSGGRYLATADGVGTGQTALDAGATQFTVVSDMPTGSQAIAANDIIVVGNYGIGYTPGDAYSYGAGAATNAARVTGVNGNTVLLAANPFAANPSVLMEGSRFFVVTSTVWYVCTTGVRGSGTLTRYETTGIAPMGAPAGAVVGRPLAQRVNGCNFDYTAFANLANSGLVSLSLTLQMPTGDDPPVALTHQINVMNSP